MTAERTHPSLILTLGGGGARGFAHIGLLQVLSEAGIKISGIVGTSMGALIGSTFAAGTDLYYLEQLVAYFSWEDLIDWRLPQLGLIDGAKIQSLINLLTKGKRFEDLEMPFWAVATDLLTGDPIVFKSGPLAAAVRASISIPGVFNPATLDGKMLVDGAVVTNVPVAVAHEMGGDLTVAVNVAFDHTQHKVNNVFDVLAKVIDIMENRLDDYQLSQADLVITPQLGRINTMDFPKGKECIALGRKAATEALPQLEGLLKTVARRQSRPKK